MLVAPPSPLRFEPPLDEPPYVSPDALPAGSAGALQADGALSPSDPARRRDPRRAGVALLCAVAVAGGVVGSLVTRAAFGTPPAPSAAVRAGAAGALDVAAVVARAGPAVVSIQVDSRRGAGAGTGVILTPDGEVLTNAHVVQGAATVRVTLAGESRSRPARVVGADPGADLALLRVDGASGLPTAVLGASDRVAIGDDVVAIGNALALEGGPTVTRGIVSGLDRSLDTQVGTIRGLIQTDASISSGNSGGPLVNTAGEVVGINTAVAASGRGTAAENIGFAIAVDRARPVIERLRAAG